MQFLLRLSRFTHIVFVLYEQKQPDDGTYGTRIHGAKRCFLKQFTCLNQRFCLCSFETYVWQKRFQNLSYLREAVYPQFRHAIVSARHIAALNPLTNPGKRYIVTSVLVQTYRRHEPHTLFRIATLLDLEHQAPISVKKPGDIREFRIFGNT